MDDDTCIEKPQVKFDIQLENVREDEVYEVISEKILTHNHVYSV